MNSLSSAVTRLFLAAGLGQILASCAVAPSDAEKQARVHLSQIGEAIHPKTAKPESTALTGHSSLEDYVRFGVLNHPRVVAAYDEWRASVASIMPARALPD